MNPMTYWSVWGSGFVTGGIAASFVILAVGAVYTVITLVRELREAETNASVTHLRRVK